MVRMSHINEKSVRAYTSLLASHTEALAFAHPIETSNVEPHAEYAYIWYMHK